MTKRYEVTWMTENTARPVADDVAGAILAAMQMTGTKGTAFPVMTVKDCYTGKITVVTVNQAYKVVKVHELD